MFYPDKVARLQEIEPLIAGGTTAVVAVIINGYLYVANVGDSRAVLVRKTSHGPIIEQVNYSPHLSIHSSLVINRSLRRQ